MNPTQHPQIAQMVKIFESENQLFRKIHRMIDLFETIIKTHSALIFSCFLAENRISDNIKGLLAEGLRTPTLGIWQFLSRELLKEMAIPQVLSISEYEDLEGQFTNEEQKQKIRRYFIKRDDEYILNPNLSSNERKDIVKKYFSRINFKYSRSLFVDNFYDYFFNDWDIKVDSVLNFRNNYAHGATPEDKVCEDDINKFTPVLEEMLDADWLNKTTVVIFSKNPTGFQITIDGLEHINMFKKDFLSEIVNNYGAENIIDRNPYLVDENYRILNLFPIIAFRKSKIGNTDYLVFFNDIKKKDEIGFLNYPNGLHIRDKEIYPKFLKVIDIESWQDKITDEFRERILELTEVFKGRTDEINYIKNFINKKDSGFLFIFGGPGIGKSALMAAVLRELSPKYRRNSDKSEGNIEIIEYFIRRGTTSVQFLSYLNNELEKRYKTTSERVNTPEEMLVSVHKQLQYVSQKLLNIDKKLVILIDGLNEGVDEKTNQYLITNSFKNILVIYSSRLVPAVAKFYNAISIEHKERKEIRGLSKSDIRAILYEVSDKYALTQAYIDKVVEKSDGNPLYVKMLCIAIENGEQDINDYLKLPAKTEEFYKAIIYRFENDPEAEILLKTFYLIAVAKDFLSAKHLELMIGLDEAQSGRAIDKLSEILYDNPETEEKDYQLFHESFREYLYKVKLNNLIEAREKIIDFCKKWSSYKKYSYLIRKYSAMYFSSHLYHAGNKDELYRLANDEDYLNYQIYTTKQFTFSFEMYEDVLNVAEQNNDIEKIVDIAIKAGKLQLRVTDSIEQIREWSTLGGKNNIERALMSIKLFKGRDQFILYSNLLYHSLFENSLENNTKREICLQIMDEIEKNVMKDTSILNWSEFMPLNYMWRIMVDLDSLEIGLNALFDRLGGLEKKDLLAIIQYVNFEKESEINSILHLALKIEDDFQRALSLKEISTRLLKHGHFKQAIEVVEIIGYLKSSALSEFSLWLLEQNQLERSLDLAEKIPFLNFKAIVLAKISTYLFKKKNYELGNLVANKAIVVAKEIDDKRKVAAVLAEISTEFEIQGNIEKAVEIAQESANSSMMIPNDFIRSVALSDLSSELSKQGRVDKMFDLVKLITYPQWKAKTLKEIFILFLNEGKKENAVTTLEEAIKVAETIEDDYIKAEFYNNVALEFIKIKDYEKANQYIEPAIRISGRISKSIDKSRILRDIYQNLLKMTRTEKAEMVMLNIVKITNEILEEWIKTEILREIIKVLSNPPFLKDVDYFINMVLEIADNIKEPYWKAEALKGISLEFSNSGQIEKALTIINRITDNFVKVKTLNEIYNDARKMGSYENSNKIIEFAIETAGKITDREIKSIAIKEISNELSKSSENLKRANEIMLHSIEVVEKINYNKRINSLNLDEIVEELSKQKMIEIELKRIHKIKTNDIKIGGMKEIFRELVMQDIPHKALRVLEIVEKGLETIPVSIEIYRELIRHLTVESAIKEVERMKNYWNKIAPLKENATEISKQGNIMKAWHQIEIEMNSQTDKSKLLAEISTELMTLGNIKFANILMNNAIQLANTWFDGYEKFELYRHIGLEFIKQKNHEKSLQMIDKSIEQTEKIKDFLKRSEALIYLSNDTLLLEDIERAGQIIEKSLILLEKTKEYPKRSLMFIEISKILLKFGNFNRADQIMEEALLSAEKIKDNYTKAEIFARISLEMISQGNFEKAFEIIDKIDIYYGKFKLLAEISNKSEKLGNFYPIFSLAMTIPTGKGILKCFESISKYITHENFGLFLSFISNEIQFEEIKLGCYDILLDLIASDCNAIPKFIPKIIRKVLYDKNLLGKALYLYSAYLRFYEEKPGSEINRLLMRMNEVIDVKDWMIEKNVKYGFDNLNELLENVKDEDTREDIQYWARKVDRGKITKDEFEEMMKKIMG